MKEGDLASYCYRSHQKDCPFTPNPMYVNAAAAAPALLLPQRSFHPLKAKTPINISLTASSQLFSSKRPPNKVSLTCICAEADDKTLLLHEWPHLLQFSIASSDLKLAHSIHGLLVKLGFQYDAFPGNNLVNMYSKLCKLDFAQKIFDEMLDRNIITWTSLINGYSHINDVESVFRIASSMHRSGEEFNEHTWSVILRSCQSPHYLIYGEQIHDLLIKNGFSEDVVVATSLLSMYSKSGYLEGVEKLFSGLSYRDVRCLNLMISEYGRADCNEKAFQVFLELLEYGLEPNDYTLTNLVSTCNEDRDVMEGRQLHGFSVKHGLVNKTSVGNAITTMYGKHGLVEDAERMFYGMDERNLISWTALFSVYLKNGNGERALHEFLKMVKLGIDPDSSCLVTVLDGCSESKNLQLGLQIHGIVIKLGLLSDLNIGTALIDMYAKCGKLQSGRLVHDVLNTTNTAFFNALLAGFTGTDGDQEEDVVSLFNKLRPDGLTPDSVTFAGLLSLSADQACLVRGESLHAFIIKTGFVPDYTVANALLTMYAKCGSIGYARQVFNGMSGYDSISWNAMISAYALHGKGKEAISLFEEMINQGLAPDKITISSVLQACSYSCILEYGFSLFNLMEIEYGIRPVIEHFACMVDLLGRAGLLSEAVDFIKACPFSNSPLLWRTLVHVCKLRGNLNFGKIAASHLLDLVPKDSGSYVLVSNMYTGAQLLEEASRARTVMKDLKVSKEVGCSWIEIDNKSHQFLASGKVHPDSREIYAKLHLLEAEMKQKYSDGRWPMDVITN